jgi:F-type H+-transporting ATPase subunit delta
MAESELTTIARPYARAAFATAVEADQLTQWSTMLGLLAAITSDEKVQSVLENPSLSQEHRAQLLVGVCGDQLDEKSKNFVSLLAEYQRIALLPEIHRLFELLKANHEKTVEVEVISAYEISEADEKKLTDTLMTRLKRDIRITSRVDRSLIGGLIVKTEDSVIDNSISGKFEKLAQAMKS